MSSFLNAFNSIAPVYDRLSKIVFGDALMHAQSSFLEMIPRDAKVLIIGGGTGVALEKLLQINPSVVVYFVDASSRMIEIAKRRTQSLNNNKVRFIHGTENNIPEGIVFDVVITHFFFDMFPEHDIDALLLKLHRKLNKKGLWIVADFVAGKTWWQTYLLKLMYLFFGLVSGLKNRKLAPWEVYLAKRGVINVRNKVFFKGFIKAGVYRGS